MNTFRTLAASAIFLSLGLPVTAWGHEPQTLLEDPGFRPETARSAAFIKRLASARMVVFPPIIRSVDTTAYSFASQQWAAEFLTLNDLGTGRVADTRLETGRLERASQWDMFQSGMENIGGQVRDLEIKGDYALVLEILIPPTPPKAVLTRVFGINCFVLDAEGNNAFSFLLNAHHKAFNDAELSATETGAEGREQLAARSTRLALMALLAQVGQEREAAEPGSTGVSLSMVDDFESALTSGTDGAGLPIGFYTFADATSAADIATTTSHPPRPGEADGNRVLELSLEVTGWAGFIHAFENNAVTKWSSADWKAFTGLRFWLKGNNTGSTLFVDVLDNRKRYSTSDDAERYTFEFRDDFSAWKQISVPFAKMVRKEIGNKAPQDGLNLEEVHGWAFGNSGSSGKITYYIDDFELYGGRIKLPSDAELPLAADESRWRSLETTEGRYRLAVIVRIDPPAGIDPAAAPRMAVFDWFYRHRRDGMPENKAELEALLAWASRLDELLVAEGNGFQFANRGGANKLSAYFYVADVPRLQALSRQARTPTLKTEMAFRVTDDPTWDTWRELGRPPAGAAGGVPIPVTALDPVMRFNGFSLRRPKDHRWSLLPSNRLDIATFAFAPLSATHSFNATVMLRGLPETFPDPGAFKSFIDSKVLETGIRFQSLSYESALTELHGQWAVSYRALFLDQDPSNSAVPLQMAVRGMVFLHPLRERTVIDAFYSERGTENELDGSLDPVGNALINGTIPER